MAQLSQETISDTGCYQLGGPTQNIMSSTSKGQVKEIVKEGMAKE